MSMRICARMIVASVMAVSLGLAMPAHSEEMTDPTERLSADQPWLLEPTGMRPASYEAEWAVVTTRVGELFPDDYAGSLVEDGHYYVGFEAEVPVAAREILDGFPATYVARTNLGFSTKDMDRVSAAVVSEVQRELPGVVMEIVPTALKPEITVTVDAGDTGDKGDKGSDGARAVPGRTSDATADLAEVRASAVQRLADWAASLRDTGIVVSLRSSGVEAPAPTAVAAGGKALSTNSCFLSLSSMPSVLTGGVLT